MNKRGKTSEAPLSADDIEKLSDTELLARLYTDVMGRKLKSQDSDGGVFNGMYWWNPLKQWEATMEVLFVVRVGSGPHRNRLNAILKYCGPEDMQREICLAALLASQRTR